MTIASLLYIGQRNVLAGRRQTTAVSIASDMMEELRQLGFHRTYAAFGHDGSAAAFQTADDLMEATAVAGGGTSGLAMADPWLQRALRGIGPTATLHVRFESLDPAGGTPPTLSAATVVRIRVEVRWDEPNRPGISYVLSTVRT